MDQVFINRFLNIVDSAVNSITMLISLKRPLNEQSIEETILLHLESGNYQYEMIKADIERDDDILIERVFHKNTDSFTCLPKPGKLWNGNKSLEIKELSESERNDLLVGLLTGNEQHFTRSTSGSPMTEAVAKQWIDQFYQKLSDGDDIVSSYNVKPDFLNTVEDSIKVAHTVPGYFNNNGRDLAMVLATKETLYVLMTNGRS